MLFNHSAIIVWNNYWLFVQGQLKQRQNNVGAWYC